MFRLQAKFPEMDFCYPIPEETGNIWCAPSDGGSWWMYSGFEHYFFERARLIRSWRATSPSREDAWKEWVRLVGK